MFWKLQENILEKEDIEGLVDFIRSTERFTQFEKVRQFEELWCAWQGCRFSVFVNSGSSANLVITNLMKQLYGWRDGDEVVVPVVTWITNITPIIQCGLTPVFVDVNLKDYSFDYEELEKKITDRTRAVFVTHLVGFPADIPRIKNILGNRDIKLVEDCCESHGAMQDGVKVGNLGSCSSFSFYWGHHMTTVEGGMICTDNEDIYKLATLKRSHGLVRELPVHYHDTHKAAHPDVDFQFLFLTDGFNVRNTELHAVLGISQVKHLDHYIVVRNRNYAAFMEILAPYSEHFFLPFSEGVSSFSLPFVFRNEKTKELFQKSIGQAEIESRPIISGNILRQPFLRKYANPADFPNGEILHQNGFYIGNNQFVDEKRLNKLAELLREFFLDGPD